MALENSNSAYGKLSVKTLARDCNISESEAKDYVAKTREAMANAYRDHKLSDVAKMFNVSEGAVRYAARQYGVKKDIRETQFKPAQYYNTLKTSKLEQAAEADNLVTLNVNYDQRYAKTGSGIVKALLGIAALAAATGIAYFGIYPSLNKHHDVAPKPAYSLVASAAAAESPAKAIEKSYTIPIATSKPAETPKAVERVYSIPAEVPNPIKAVVAPEEIKKPVDAPKSVPAIAPVVVAQMQPKPIDASKPAIVPSVQVAAVTNNAPASSKGYTTPERAIALTADIDSTGAGDAGVILSRNRLYFHPKVLFGDETGISGDIGLKGEKYTFHLAAQKVGDFSDIIPGIERTFDSRLKKIALNGYFGDVSGADILAEINLAKSEKSRLDAILGGYAFDLNGENASGVYAGLRASHSWKHLGLFAEADIYSDDKLMGENFLVRGGLYYGADPDSAMDMPSYFGLNTLHNGVLGHPQNNETTTAATSGTTVTSTGTGTGTHGDGLYHGPEPGPVIIPETPATP